MRIARNFYLRENAIAFPLIHFMSSWKSSTWDDGALGTGFVNRGMVDGFVVVVIVAGSTKMQRTPQSNTIHDIRDMRRSRKERVVYRGGQSGFEAVIWM